MSEGSLPKMREGSEPNEQDKGGRIQRSMNLGTGGTGQGGRGNSTGENS